MATRRNFFKYLGLAGGVAGGGIVAAAVVLPDSESAKCVKEIQNAGYNGKLTLGAEYGERAPLPNGPFYSMKPVYIKGTEKHVTASMTVGPDGEMYLMTNGKWRRIVTE